MIGRLAAAGNRRPDSMLPLDATRCTVPDVLPAQYGCVWRLGHPAAWDACRPLRISTGDGWSTRLRHIDDPGAPAAARSGS